MTPAAAARTAAELPPPLRSAERAPSPLEAHLQAVARQRARRVVAVGLSLGLLAEALFDGAWPGVSVAVFAAAGVLGVRVLAGAEGWQQAGPSRLLLVPLFFFAAMVGVRDSETLTLANLGACLALAALWAQLFNGEQRRPMTFAALLWAPVRAVLHGAAAVPGTLGRTVDSRQARARVGDGAVPALRALAITVPLVAVFVGLLMAGDERFARFVSSGADRLDGGRLLRAALVVLGVGLGLAGLITHALRRRRAEAEAQEEESGGPLRFTDALVPLVSLSALFGVFGLVRLSAVLAFDKYEAAARPEFTYAREAHQGFAALMAVVVLTLGVLLTFSRFTRLESPRHARWFAAAGTALVLLTGPILTSGLSRLVLYQQMYGYTELRLYATWATLVAAGLLGWRALTLWRAQAAFGTGALAVLLLALAGLNALNPDAYIAAHNLARPQTVVALDTEYLLELSADAAPVVVPYLTQQGELHRRDRYLARVTAPQGLFGWRLSRARAAALEAP